MKTLKIVMKPLDAYFLGGERNAAHENSPTQRTQRNPYLIHSNRMLSQSAAFGALRYLGIRSPKPSFRLEPEDRANIGAESYQITSEGQKFGKIHCISPVLLVDRQGQRWMSAPRGRVALPEEQEGKGLYQPFTSFALVETALGTRCLPEEYNEKTAWDGAELLCLETGALRGSVFGTQMRTGINRSSQKKARNGKNQNDGTPSGYFKKEYVTLDPDFSFLFYAQAEDGFFCRRDGVVYMGQGRTPFAVQVEEAEKEALALPPCCCPAAVRVNGEERPCAWAAALSDVYHPGDVNELKQRCSLMIAEGRSYRTFITKTDAENSNTRYEKGQIGLKLIPAGSVFLFLGTEKQTPQEQMEEFAAYLKGLSAHARKAGFNRLCYSTAVKCEEE